MQPGHWEVGCTVHKIKTVKGLTSVIMNYFLKLFAYCISTKQGESEKVKHGLNSLVCHAFGDHCKCYVLS